jgi:hypothetical protein
MRSSSSVHVTPFGVFTQSIYHGTIPICPSANDKTNLNESSLELGFAGLHTIPSAASLGNHDVI